MTDVKLLLENRSILIARIVREISTYYDIIKNSVSSINPRLNEKCIEAIQTIEVKNSSLGQSWGQIIDRKSNLMGLFVEIYENIREINGALDVIEDVITNEKYAKMVLFNMSATFTTGIYHQRNKLIDMIEKYKETSIEDDIIIINDVIGRINVQANLSDALLTIHENVDKVNKFLIELIRESLRYVDGTNKLRLLELIETQKNVILNATNRVEKLNFIGPQCPLVRYGLCPVTLSLPIWDITKRIKTKWVNKSSFETNMQRISEELNATIIVIDKTMHEKAIPLEFDIRGLVSLQYIIENDLQTTPTMGLNKKVIDRFNTTRELAKGKSFAKQTIFSVLKKDAKIAYVFETLNGSFYRLMSNSEEFHVQISTIMGLINGLSTRSMKYNMIQEDEIINRCFDPRSQSILIGYSEEKRPQSDAIKTHIMNDFAEDFAYRITKRMPSTGNDFHDMVIDIFVVSEILLERLTALTGAHTGGPEYVLTFVSKIDSIIRQFTKEIENQYRGANINDLVFKELDADDLKKHLTNIFADIIRGAVNALDKLNAWSEYDLSLKEFFLEHKYAVL